MALTENIAERYVGFLATLAPALNPHLQPAALKDVIDEARAGEDPAEALTKHVAANSLLTAAAARPLVETALAAAPGDSTAQANAASQALAGLPGVNVELSDAVMLSAAVRVWSAVAFAVILVGCIISIVGIGTESGPSEVTIIVLAVLAILSLVAILVLVMGYKTVKVKVGSTS
jgi:hypothetical protein